MVICIRRFSVPEETLTHDLRILKRTQWSHHTLCQAGEYLPKGTVIPWTERQLIFYDHRFQVALRFDCDGNERFILQSDVSAMIDSFAPGGVTDTSSPN
jgi:hypothetical protein